MKRIISGILGVAMATSMAVGLSSCGGRDENTLLWYMMGDKPEAHDEVMAKVNEIVEAELGVKIDMQYIDSASYTEKMKLKMASGEDYDLAFTGYINPYQTAVEMGGLYDITDLVEQVGMSEAVDQYYLDAAKVDGKIYGVPNIQIISNPVSFNILPSIVKECGIESQMKKVQDMASCSMSFDDLKEMFDTYTEMFAAVKAKRPDLYTWNPSGGNIATYTNYEVMYNLAIKKDGSDPTLYIEYETDEWKYGCQLVREWYKAGYIRSDVASVGTSLSTTEERLKVAFNNSSWGPGNESAEEGKYGEAMEYALLYEPYVNRTSALLTMISVGANTKHAEEAVKFIKLINENAELYNLLIWGIEGEHYTKNEDGTITVIQDGGYADVGVAGWKYGKQFNSYVVEGQPLDQYATIEKMNNEAVKSPMLGFVPDTSNITTEIANVSSVIDEYKAKILYGTEDFDVWYDGFCAKMEQAGIKKIQSELQAQYDAFLATK